MTQVETNSDRDSKSTSKPLNTTGSGSGSGHVDKNGTPCSGKISSETVTVPDGKGTPSSAIGKKKTDYIFRSKIPSPMRPLLNSSCTPRHEKNSKTPVAPANVHAQAVSEKDRRQFHVYQNGIVNKPTLISINFASLKTWDGFIKDLKNAVSKSSSGTGSQNSSDAFVHIQNVYTCHGRRLESLNEIESISALVISNDEPFVSLPYSSEGLSQPPTQHGPAQEHQVKSRNSVSSRARRVSRGTFTKSVVEEPKTGFTDEADGSPSLAKACSEQNVLYPSTCANSPIIPCSQSQLPTVLRQNKHTRNLKPRPASCYMSSSHSGVSTRDATNGNGSPGLNAFSGSRIPKRIIPSSTFTKTRSNENLLVKTGKCTQLQDLIHTKDASTHNPSPTPFVKTVKDSSSHAEGRRRPVSADKSNRQEQGRHEFVRPRLITVIRSGRKPRKASRYLLNRKTAVRFDQVLSDITNSIKADWGAVRKVYTLKGKEVQGLEDFFSDNFGIFLVCPNDRVSPEDFQLDSEECKNMQPFVKVNLSTCMSKSQSASVENQRSQPHKIQRPKSVGSQGNQSNHKSGRNSVRSYPAHPKHIPVEQFPAPILNKFVVGKIIGDGNFAVVRTCCQKNTGQDYALKVIDKLRSEGRDAPPAREVEILSKLESHPNVISLVEHYDFNQELYVVMELVSGGDLFDAIAEVTKFSEEESACMTRDVASALSFLHDRQIVHRDIKPENLLVFMEPDGRKRIKVGDFGLAQGPLRGPLYTVCGTPTYVAPEILAETGYGLKVDIWALGVILYVLLCGYPPFVSQSSLQEELFDMILAGEYDFPREQWETISDEAKDLVVRMIESDVDLRLDAQEVLEHPWLAMSPEERRIKRNLFFRKDFKSSVFEAMGLEKLLYPGNSCEFENPSTP